MTLERRVEVLEQAVHDILNGIQQLTNVVREHNQQNAELFQGLVGIVTNQQEQLAAQQDQVAEYRRDAQQMQRLWVHLARKHGWLEDEDWPPPEES